MISFSVGLEQKGRILAKLRALSIPPNVPEQLMNEAVSGIKRRVTRDGKDVNGSALSPYSRDYAAIRGSHGRRVSPPDLTMTGQMMRSLQTISSTGGTTAEARAGFIGSGTRRTPRRAGQNDRKGKPSSKKFSGKPKSVSNSTIAWATDKQRNWFGFDAKTQKRVVEIFRKWLKRFLGGS